MKHTVLFSIVLTITFIAVSDLRAACHECDTELLRDRYFCRSVQYGPYGACVSPDYELGETDCKTSNAGPECDDPSNPGTPTPPRNDQGGADGGTCRNEGGCSAACQSCG